jgi:RNA binding exosome subunit
VYGKVKELLPNNAPEPLGKYVTLSHYMDANLMHNITSGKSVTGILHLVNKTPIDWYSKKQATVETATYGSEFFAARVCVEQIIDLLTTLRYLGVPIRDKTYMFRDNKSVVDSSMQLHAKLHKQHTMLSFHRVREAIASGIVGFFYIPGDINPADILSKHWGYSQIRERLKSLLF